MGITNVFHKIWGGVEFVAVHVAAGFKSLFGAQAAEDFAKASLELLKTAVGQVALAAVEGLMSVGSMSGSAKQAAAFEQIVASLAAKGIELGKDVFAHEINLLIELAVAAIKGKFAPVIAPTQ